MTTSSVGSRVQRPCTAASHHLGVFYRNALFDIRAEKLQPEEQQEDEEELDVTIEGTEDEEEEEVAEMWDMWDGQISLSDHQERNPSQALSSSSQVGGAPAHSFKLLQVFRWSLCVFQVDLKVDVCAQQQETVDVKQKIKDLQERLMVGVQEDLLGEVSSHWSSEQTSSLPHCGSSPSAAGTTVQQDSKQVQVDLQDLGYETSGRSENEAEREDTSSPGSSDVHQHLNTQAQ